MKTVETQVPFLKESFFTTTFKGRRKSSVTNILRKQQHSLLNQQQQQQQCILEQQQQQHPKQFLSPSVKNGPGHDILEHRRLARSTSSPLCKTAECAGADGERKEGQKERKDQREAVQGRVRERGVSGSEPEAVSASLLLLSSSASVAPGEAASSSQLLLTVVDRQQGLESSERALTNRGTASVAAQEEANHDQPRPQQHGLLAKGVRLLKSMGNQETKQKKGGGSGLAAGDVSCDGDADEGKSKKSHNKISKGGGGGEHSAKKKSKSESKGSVFSGMRIRKSLSKAKGLSKDDMLEDGRSACLGQAGLKSCAETSLSADEMGMLSDVEGDLSRLTADGRQSLVDEAGLKTSSGSDADLYSFHSATAETEDLLSDIQRAMRDQCEASDKVVEMVTDHVSRGLTAERNSAPKKVIPNQLFNLDKEHFSFPICSESVAEELSTKYKKLQNERHNKANSGHSSDSGSQSESGPQSSAPDTERSSGSLCPKTNSTYSFPDTTATTPSYESAEEPLDDLESPVLGPSKNRCVPCVRIDPVVAGVGPLGVHKSASSTDLSMEREEEKENGKWDFLSLKRRKSSMSNSQLTTDGTPLSQPRRTSSSSSTTVKLYPPVHPSYVKTTTRQLTSPIGSPITSPHVLRKTDANVPSVDSGGAQVFRVRKQRSSSIAGPLSGCADWSSDLDELRIRKDDRARFLEHETPQKSNTGGPYWTLGCRRAQYGRQASTATGPYLDVFSGESHMKHVTELILTTNTAQQAKRRSDLWCRSDYGKSIQ